MKKQFDAAETLIISAVVIVLLLSVVSLFTGCGKGGADGALGPQGLPGANTSSVYTVELCPKQGAPVYASNIPEYGLCINGLLYGLTQDAHGNFEIGALMNGNYIDYANNTTCNLTVNGCAVTQN